MGFRLLEFLGLRKKNGLRDKLRKAEGVFPRFPAIVLFFYLAMMLLWNLNWIPQPEELLVFVERLVENFGIYGVLIASFIEGLAFVGHQFPGMTLMLISVIVSGSNLTFMAAIIASISIALTLSSVVNYYAGTLFAKKNKEHKKVGAEKTLFLSALHPNFLSLYFFHRGMNRKGLKEVLLVPVIIFPYGLIIAFIISLFSEFIRNELLTSHIFFISVFIGWFLVELYMNLRKRERK